MGQYNALLIDYGRLCMIGQSEICMCKTKNWGRGVFGRAGRDTANEHIFKDGLVWYELFIQISYHS